MGRPYPLSLAGYRVQAQLLSTVDLKITESTPFISSGAQYTAQTFPCKRFDRMVNHTDEAELKGGTSYTASMARPRRADEAGD